MCGCDMTSTFFNKDKNKFAAHFENCKNLHDAAEVIKNVNEYPEIFQAGNFIHYPQKNQRFKCIEI